MQTIPAAAFAASRTFSSLRKKWRYAMRRVFIALCMSLLCAATAAPAHAAVSVSIGINIPAYPRMVVVPGYPVYYAPTLGTNFFFYDGMYWLFMGDRWYMSSWYNGPWFIVEPDYVPYYLLRVPVRYYMAPPPYFHGWSRTAPPRWGSHWGPQWESQHHDWDRWDHHGAPRPAPLPTYQRSYSHDRYPTPAQQADLQGRNYRYQPHTEVAREHVQQQQAEHRRSPGPQQRPPNEQQRQSERAPQMAPQHQQERPTRQEPGGGDPARREAGPHAQPQQMPPPQPAAPHQQQQQQQGHGQQQERGRGNGHGNEGKDKRDEGGPHGK
jgi:hypothetical protein